MNRSLGVGATRAIDFPEPPIPGSALLRPILSWSEMKVEARVTGVQFLKIGLSCSSKTTPKGRLAPSAADRHYVRGSPYSLTITVRPGGAVI